MALSFLPATRRTTFKLAAAILLFSALVASNTAVKDVGGLSPPQIEDELQVFYPESYPSDSLTTTPELLSGGVSQRT